MFARYVPGDGWDPGFVDWPPGTPVPFTVSLPGAVGQGRVTIAMFDDFDKSHEVEISINGTDYGSFTWSGTAYNHVTISDVALLDGNNTVALTCVSGVDTILLDWIEITYTRDNVASGNSLKFSNSGKASFVITNVDGSEHLVYDISDAADVGRVVNAEVVADEVVRAADGRRQHPNLSGVGRFGVENPGCDCRRHSGRSGQSAKRSRLYHHHPPVSGLGR
jgi:hypothetical protein